MSRLSRPGDRGHFFKLLKGVLLAAGFVGINTLFSEAERYQNEKSFLCLAESPFRIRANPYILEVALCWFRIKNFANSVL